MAEKLPKTPEYDPSNVILPMPRGPAPNKKPELAIVAVIISVIIVVGVIALALSFNAPQGPPPSPTLPLKISDVVGKWEELDSYGLQPDEGNQFLWLTFNVTNEGTKNQSVNWMDFSLNISSGQEFITIQVSGPDHLLPGQKGSYRQIYEIPKNAVPSVIVYDDFINDPLSAPVLQIDPLVPDVVFMIESSTWRLVQSDGIPAPGATKYLWIVIDVANQWTKQIDTTFLNFNVTGKDGTSQVFLWKTGSDHIAAGITAQITLIAWIDASSWAPKTLNYWCFFGPKYAVNVPDPIWA